MRISDSDGFIEKYVDEAVLAIFGMSQDREDDPIRAIQAAREIHHAVDAVASEVAGWIGQAISMHTEIN